MVSPNPFYANDMAMTLDNPVVFVPLIFGVVFVASAISPYANDKFVEACDYMSAKLNDLKTEYGLDGKCYES